MISLIRKSYDWMGSAIYSPYATLILGILFYLEAIFFIPTDPILIIYCIERRNKALQYATVATIASVLGGLTSYCIGFMLWQTMGQQIIHNKIVNYVLSPQTFVHLSEHYRQYEWWAILVAGFTPIPYKAATLTAGFCQLSLIPFIICSCIARGTRFFLFACTIKIFGDSIKQSIDRYFNFILPATLLVTVFTIWLFT